ncbi:MAG: PCMD domain-containing protein [Fibrobacter sp.]|nr:PCMD domain-containing protein [Fibrobacter sp.]
MKQLISLFALALTVLSFVACTADYDEFEASHYKVLKNITFEEQDGEASVSEETHIIKVTTVAPPESLETWDSLTIESFSASNLATLHLVDGKFKEFPSDSAALDSLAEEVSYVKKSLKSGSKIRVPKSQVVYLMLVAENGDPAIWKLEIEIPGVEKEEYSSDSKDAKSSSSVKDGASSSSSAKAESSSSKALKTDTDLQLTFKNQFKVARSGDTISIKLASDQKIEDAEVESFKISDGASVSPDPKDVKDWSKAQEIVVTAEDGKTKQTWVVILDVAAEDEKPASTEKDLVSISAKNEIAPANIDSKKNTVVVHLQKEKEIASVELTIKVSESASQNLKAEALDLREPVTMTIMAEDGSTVEWTISADFEEAAVAPRITAMKIAGNDAVIESEGEEGSEKFFIHYDNLDFLTDLTNLEVSGIELSEDAFVEDLEDGEKYDLSFKKVKVSNGFVDQEYEIRAGYQLPNSDFSAISYGDVWHNANQDFTIYKVTSATLVSIGKGKGVQLKTGSAAGKIASGSLYTADFNPKNVGITSLAKTSDWPDGNELVDFGKKFNARPRYLEFLASYDGKKDSCDIYLVLENRTGDKNSERISSDVNKLVASAWYRSTSMNNDGRPNPDVVSISEPDANGMTRIRMKINYGEPLENSPIYNSSAFETTVQSKTGKAINNGMIQGTGDEPVTHIRMVYASSGDGQHYNGISGATLIVDEMRLIY